MNEYTPSGKHPPLYKEIFYGTVAALMTGILGAGTIWLFSGMMVSTACQAASGSAISFMGLITASLAVWLLGFIPFGMGKLGGWIAASESRHPDRAVIVGLITGLVTFSVVVLALMIGYQMSFVQWSNLSWATAKGVSDGFSAMGLFHLIPLVILVASMAFTADEMARRPFCEKCGIFCTAKSLGEMPEVKRSTPASFFATRDTISDLIGQPKPKRETSDEWVEAKVHLCLQCRETGYLSVDGYGFVTGPDGKTVKQKSPLLRQAAMSPSQVQDVLRETGTTEKKDPPEPSGTFRGI